VSKALGDLSLLMGILHNAVTHYSQSIEILRLTTDYVWHASALEGIGMALIIIKNLKLEFTVDLRATKLISRSLPYCRRYYSLVYPRQRV